MENKVINKGWFTRERVLGNQSAKGNPPNERSFKNGQTAGDKSYTWKGGIQTNKNDVVYLYQGINKRIRRPHYVWQQAHGEVPKGYVLWHIDGNKNNDDLENLELITRAELVKRNNPKAH